MFGIVILYLLVGVTFNYLWDVTICMVDSEENRFTFKERLIVSMIWPVALGYAVFVFITAFFKK